MIKIEEILKNNIKKIILFYIYMQPLLDITTGLTQNYLNINFTISSIIRLVFLILCLYYIIKLDKAKNKKQNITKSIIIIIYIILFSITTITYKGTNALSYELKNTINTFYLPIITLALMDIFEQYKIKIDIKHIIYTYLIYILLIAIPNITHTGFNSYAISKTGSSGWFSSANATGNILSILLPIVILFIIKNKNKKILTTTIIITTLYSITSLGTKVPIISLIICILTTLLYFIIKWIKEKQKTKITISITGTIIVTLLTLILIPKTSFYKNIQIHKEYLGITNYTEILTNYNLIDHFIFSQRLTFLNNTNKTYQKSNIIEKTIGIGYIENYGTDNVSTKTIEIDYLDILYRNGIIGFIIYFSIMIPIIIKTIKKTKQKTLINLEYKLSISLIIIIAFFAGHMIITPNVCIFVALIIAIINKGGLYEKTN